MLTIDHSARTGVAAPPSRCLEVLADVEAYPRWASLIAAAEVTGPGRMRMRAEVLGLGFEMECALELRDDRAVLRRLPYDAQDDERYEATWTLTPRGEGSAVELHVVAAIDAPGPASLVRGRVRKRLVDDLLADFARAL
jgi:ribosome-associated toxin RatA of RatAB toxin-antitoxin module